MSQPEFAESSDLLDLAYRAWVVIANVNGGNWDGESDEWREAAIRWRDAFHAELDRHHSDGSEG